MIFLRRGQRVVILHDARRLPGMTLDSVLFDRPSCIRRLRVLSAHNGDTDRLGQLITNLLTNAIHYNKPNGEIRVSTRSANGGAVLTVADSRQGIAAEDVPHVFERFYRADKSRSRAEGRSGLGLAICKAIVDSHGGSIDVSSQPGAGTTFTVRLTADHFE